MLVETLLRDIRFGFRMLLRTPGVTAVAVLALALGIGVNSAIFSIVNAVLLRPLPVAQPQRLVTFVLSSRRLNVNAAQPGFSTYATWTQQSQSFQAVAAAAPGTAAWSTGGLEETVRFWRVTSTFLPTLGVSPALGRNFLTEEDRPGGARVALLSHSFWKGRFGGDAKALGATVKIDGEPYTIAGVLPAGFHVDGRPADVYAPYAKSLNEREWIPSNVYGRLKPGATIQQAQAEIEAHESHLPPHPLGWKTRLWSLREFQVRDVRLSLWVLLGAVGMVLLIACANIASLLLARASARQKELAVRTALGAGKKRLVRQLLTESTLLALAGGTFGVAVAAACVRLVPLLHNPRLPGLLEQTRVDGVVLAFTLGISLLTGLVFGTAPAVAAPRVDVFATLKEGGRAGSGGGRRRGWNFLVVTETALALVLAIGASLLIRTFFYLRDVAPGFKVDRLLTARITPPQSKFVSREQALAYWQDAIGRVRAIPGVQAASFAETLPMTGDNQVMSCAIEGHHFARPEDYPTLWFRNVETGYFRTLQIPLLRGRLFNERDNASGPKVAIVNESFARRFWPGQDPIGKHLDGGAERREVIGVVGDVKSEDSTKAAPAEVIHHYLQVPPARIALAVRIDPRVSRDPLAFEPAVRAAVAEVDSTQPVTQFANLQQVISDRIAPKRLSAQLIAVFAGLALVLAAIGIYGVLSFAVAQRTHEIGVRVALGADPRQVLRMVGTEAALLAGAGTGLGVASALALTRVMRSLLFGVSATDPLVYAGSAAVLFGVAVAAALLPAFRAARIDPLVALRHE